MLDSYIRPVIDKPLNFMARGLGRISPNANYITGTGFVFSLGAFAALYFQNYSTAITFILLSRLMDGLDGPTARLTQPTDLGGFYDIVSDMVFYSGIVFFFALGRPDMALYAAFLIFAFIGTGTSFLTYAIFASKRGLNHERQGRKSFFYLSGLTEGSESVAALLLICIIPEFFPAISMIFGSMCWLTTLGRVLQARTDFIEQ